MVRVGGAWAVSGITDQANQGMGLGGWRVPSIGPRGGVDLATCVRTFRASADLVPPLPRAQAKPSGSTGVVASPSDPWLTAR